MFILHAYAMFIHHAYLNRRRVSGVDSASAATWRLCRKHSVHFLQLFRSSHVRKHF